MNVGMNIQVVIRLFVKCKIYIYIDVFDELY